MPELFGDKTATVEKSPKAVVATIEKIRSLVATKLHDIDLSEPELLEQTKKSIEAWVKLSFENFLFSRFIYNTSYPDLIAELVKVVVNEQPPNKIDVIFPSVDYASECINMPTLVANAYYDYLLSMSPTAPDQIGRVCTEDNPYKETK